MLLATFIDILLLCSLSKKKRQCLLQENYWAEKYDKLLHVWAKKLDKIENTAKRRYVKKCVFGSVMLVLGLGLGLKGLALAKISRPKFWQTTKFTINFH